MLSVRGSAGILTLGVAGLTVTLALSLLGTVAWLSRVATAQAEVDVAALEVADSLSGRLSVPSQGGACTAAITRAERGGLALISCDEEDLDARVTYRVRAGLLSSTVRAHAGPPPLGRG